MPKLTVFEELQSAVRTAAQEAGPKQTSRIVAAKMIEDYPDLIQPFREGWVLEKVAALIAALRLEIRRSHDLQYRLGFGHIPRKIELRSGKVVTRDEATIGALRELAAQLRATRHPALDEVENAISLMSKYRGKKKTQRMTWGQVVKQEAEKIK